MRRTTTSGAVSVSGPGCDVGGLPTVGAGVSRGLTAAERSTEDGTWYVRDGGESRFMVTRQGKLTFITPCGNGASTRGQVAPVVEL